MGKHKKDLLVILLFPVVATFLSFLFKVNAFYSVILYFLLPALYLTYRSPKFALKAALFAVVIGLPVMIIVDYFAHINNQWLIPSSIIDFRLFGYVTLEVIFWAVVHIYLVIMFFQHFLDHHMKQGLLLEPRMIKFVRILTVCFVIFLTSLLLNPSVLIFPYFYLLFGLVAILLPIAIELSHHPKFLAKFFQTAIYFFYLTFLYEVSALKLGWWEFPDSKFIGMVNFWDVFFPFEELFFWIIMFAMAVLSVYIALDDREAAKD